MTHPPAPAGAVSAVVLAAGAGSRFGGGKLRAPLGGVPVLQHVLDAIAAAGIDDVVVVLGADAEAIERAIAWRSERRVLNPDPALGLSSSVRVGLEAAGTDVDAVLLVLGDQPALREDVIRALLAADTRRPVVVPRFADDGARNPVLLRRPAFALAGEAAGDRGLGPLLDAHPDLVTEIGVAGSNPDVDRREDLAAAAAASWAARVRADRDQVDRIREVPDGHDFYAPVRSVFRADPDRTDEPVLDALQELAVPGETWLDIGAGAGRYALPLARIAGEVIALDPSESMLAALDEDARTHRIGNVRTVHGRWPPDPAAGDETAELLPLPCADVALIAHVGYDVEEILPFVEAMEAAARRLCVALLMEVQPSLLSAPLWPAVHGEERVRLPGVNDLIELLRLRGRDPIVRRLPREPRSFADRDGLLGLVRRQLWVAEGSPKDALLLAAVEPLIVEEEHGVRLGIERIGDVGLVTWRPAAG
ncbi:MAG TPA: NTP transferase domain-containing protein [Clostridia bacterium]|nr:NTP transferase domain-containing protein [Clostridia bacterium]